MKKRLLIVIDSLSVGGAEKSLLSFLSVLDKEAFDVELQLFAYGGQLEEYIPDRVRLLPPMPFTSYAGQSILRIILAGKFALAVRRMKFSLAIRRKNIRHIDRAVHYWKCFSRYFASTDVKYDVAIAYAQNLPTLYVADKVAAAKKFAWVNVRYVPTGENYAYFKNRYEVMDRIVAVSESAKEEFVGAYPHFADRTVVIRDIIDEKYIRSLAAAPIPFPVDHCAPVIVTMARLNAFQKGFDIALEAARLLHSRGVQFRWYVLGEGPYRPEMEAFIEKNGLGDCFMLLGALANPYPVLAQADIYVQTSRHEGFGLSIAEARLLNIPVVTTEFDAVWLQMVQGKNGIVTPLEASAVADAVQQLLGNGSLREEMREYLKTEPKGNTAEIWKFYDLLR